MAEDLEKFILRGMDKAQRKMGWLPNFMVKTEPPDKTRLIFKNVIEPPINFGDWTVITVSIQDFELMCDEFPRILKYDSKPLQVTINVAFQRAWQSLFSCLLNNITSFPKARGKGID